MRRELLAQPKFLVPLMVLLWLAASLPLSVSEATHSTDDACVTDPQAATEGVWGQPDDPYHEGGWSHLTVLATCYHVNGPLVWGEQWRDVPGENYGEPGPWGCIINPNDPEVGYNTCQDADMNWYMRLSKAELSRAGVTSGEIKKIQRYSQCKEGYRKDPSKWCNFLTEGFPKGDNNKVGNYTDWNPTDDQPALNNPCLDEDYGGGGRISSCKDIVIDFIGPRVKDNSHGWKEVHPIRRQVWTDRSGTTHNCALDQNNQVRCT